MITGRVTISHKQFEKEYLYATAHGDGNGGRSVHTWMDGGDAAEDVQAHWIITPEGDHFLITSSYYQNEYLCATERSDGSSRRFVQVCSGSPSADPQAHWIITHHQDGCFLITSGHFQGEYLYATQNNDGRSRRFVHTWMSGSSPQTDTQAHWIIERNGFVLPTQPSLQQCSDGVVQLRVLTFNIWCDGGTSLRRTIDCIQALSPDVICLQEAKRVTVAKIAQALGLFFSDDACILSRFPVSKPYRAGTWTGHKGADLAAVHMPVGPHGLFRILVGNCHLQHSPYGPYLFRYYKGSAEDAVKSELQYQVPPLKGVLQDLRDMATFTEGCEDPYILCGDFNAASHLDYVQEGVQWPTSLACEAAHMVDTYALANPDQLGAWRQQNCETPGITWSCLPAEEPSHIFDRIDFIYASASRLHRVSQSTTVDSTTPGCSPWPSDHRAVLSDLLLKL